MIASPNAAARGTRAARPDFAAARAAMVASQLRVSKVTDEQVIAAMGDVPRELFVPADRQAVAYADQDVALGGGRFLLQPLVIARMLSMANLIPGQRGLIIGAGSGYSAAIVSAVGAQVTALEQSTLLRAQAATAWAATGCTGIVPVDGPLADGWAAAAPYDLILVDGGFETVPASWAVQLAAHGVCIGVHVEDGIGHVAVGRKTGNALAFVPFMEAQVAVLPGLTRPKAFSF